jgi:membrane associated rhomboid family serine protease
MFPLYDKNRSTTRPLVTWALIILNGAVFWWELTHGFNQNILDFFGVTPIRVLQGKRLFSLFTSMFLHSSFWHILGNMVYLFVFGDNVEDQFGHMRYFLLYFIFGVVGGLSHAITAINSGGEEAFIPALGASGAVSGILGSYLLFFPRARIVSVVPSFLLFSVAPVPAWVFVGFWFLLQLLYSGGNAAVAYTAHVGGFLTGVLVALLFKLKNRV